MVEVDPGLMERRALGKVQEGHSLPFGVNDGCRDAMGREASCIEEIGGLFSAEYKHACDLKRNFEKRDRPIQNRNC